MTLPVNIDDLTEVTSVNRGDFMITENQPEQATRKSPISQIQSIAVNNFDSLPFPLLVGDKFLIQNSLGQKKSTVFSNVTFPSGTRIWIYAGVPPSGWKPVPGTGDKLLAVKGGDTYVTGGTSEGDWLYPTVNGDSSSLTPEQMPAHSHRGTKTLNRTNNDPLNSLPPLMGKEIEDDDVIRFRYAVSESTGGNFTHNHGDLWRPTANVGIIMEKI